MPTYAKPTKFSNLNVSNITLGEAKKNTYGGLTYYPRIVNNDGTKSAIVLQTEKMFCPMGVTEAMKFEKDDKGNDVKTPTGNFQINMTFSDMDGNKPLTEMREKLEQIDQQLMSELLDRKDELKNKKLNKNTVEALYGYLLKEPHDPKYSEYMKVKVYKDKDTGKFNGKTYLHPDMSKQVDLFDTIFNKRCKCVVICQLNAIYVISGKFHPIIRADKILVYIDEENREYAFDVSDNEDDSESDEESDEELDGMDEFAE